MCFITIKNNPQIKKKKKKIFKKCKQTKMLNKYTNSV